MATSHKVILNLLKAVLDLNPKEATAVAVAHKGDEDQMDGAHPNITPLNTNEAALLALQDGTANVVGGTAWMWAREDFASSIDVLFIDEAAQMSLANALAASHAATRVVLLGDPQQLEQPKKGSHPEGVDASALGHMLGDHPTIPKERGIFLPITWRLAPSVAGFTSELFYDGLLTSKPGLENQALAGTGDHDGSGLRLLEVARRQPQFVRGGDRSDRSPSFEARLFEPECKTPRQMRLANALCRFGEMARGTQRSVTARSPSKGEATKLSQEPREAMAFCTSLLVDVAPIAGVTLLS